MKSAKIKEVIAYEILDSRGWPTVKVVVELESGDRGSFSVPSGISTGECEAKELRDNDIKRYFGKGVLRAVENINKIIRPKLIGEKSTNQFRIDSVLIDLDGTEDKSHLGSNAILGVSIAAARASSVFFKEKFYRYIHSVFSDFYKDIEIKIEKIPIPMINVINGGAHADNCLDFQEFMIVPHGIIKFSEALRACCEIFHTLKGLLKKKRLTTAVGDEGGFAPNIVKIEQVIEILIEAIKCAGYEPGVQIGLALDIAASEFFEKNTQRYILRQFRKYNSEQMISYIENLYRKYPIIISIEDCLDQQDWSGWKSITTKLSNKIQLVGDDLFVTNSTLIKYGIEQCIANCILIKPNQIGTLSETLESIYLGKRSGYQYIISHRSGETEDTSIADLAVATQAKYVKMGSVCRSERIAKYNRLLEIENELTCKTI